MGSKRSTPRALAELAGWQHGLVALRQLLALGWTRDRVKSAVRRGWLIPVTRGVYAVGHRPAGERARWMAGVLSLDDAVLSHVSAAMLWGLLPTRRAPVHVSAARKARARPTLIPHRTTTLSGADRTLHDGIPTTTAVPRTAIDLADLLPPEQYARAIERVPLLDVGAFRRALARHPGRKAARPLGTLLDLYDDGARTRSRLEREFVGLVRRARIERPLVNQPLHGHERDFAWPAHRLAIEVDGGAFHAGRTQRAHDHRRDLELHLHGWRVQRFTYEQVVLDPHGTAAAVRALLAAAP